MNSKLKSAIINKLLVMPNNTIDFIDLYKHLTSMNVLGFGVEPLDAVYALEKQGIVAYSELNKTVTLKKYYETEQFLSVVLTRQELFDLDTVLARELRAIQAAGGLDDWYKRLEALKKRLELELI